MTWPSGFVHRHRQIGGGAALPDYPNLGDTLLGVDGEHDLVDDGPGSAVLRSTTLVVGESRLL
jgi:hypothetical protein